MPLNTYTSFALLTLNFKLAWQLRINLISIFHLCYLCKMWVSVFWSNSHIMGSIGFLPHWNACPKIHIWLQKICHLSRKKKIKHIYHKREKIWKWNHLILPTFCETLFSSPSLNVSSAHHCVVLKYGVLFEYIVVHCPSCSKKSCITMRLPCFF